MKAVNLIPSDAQRGGSRSLRLSPATYGLLGVLVVALALVTTYVVFGNKVSNRQAELTSLRAQLSTAQRQASQLSVYTQFASMAQTRVQNVRGIAATRFAWNTALSNLARVIPANTSLQSLNGTVVPGAGTGGNSGLRTDLPGPAFEMTGCTSSQDEVARLISRLRSMPEVVRVALNSSAAPTQVAGSGSGTTGPSRGCPPNAPVFNLVVFFQPVSGAGPTGAASVAGSSSTGGSK